MSFKDDKSLKDNLSKEKVINEILNQDSKYYESSKSHFNYSLNNRVETDHQREVRIAAHKATEVKNHRNKLLLVSPSSQNKSQKASLFTNRDYQSSPNSSKENSQVNANSGSGNYDRRDHFNKLSSTAAFKTLTSSPNKMFQSDSPGSQKIIKIREEQKTVKRDSRGAANYKTTPKLINLEPELENINPFNRKPTHQHLVVMDEDHAEPFEIIETTDCEKLFKTISPLKQRNSVIERDNVKDYCDRNIKHSHISSFCEGDFFKPKAGMIQSNQTSKSSLMNLHIMKDMKFENVKFLENNAKGQVTSNYYPLQRNVQTPSISNQLKLKQIPKKKKMNFITENIKNISKFKGKKSKERENDLSTVPSSKYLQIHNNRIMNSKERSKIDNTQRTMEHEEFSRRGYQTVKKSDDLAIEIKTFDPKIRDVTKTFMFQTHSPKSNCKLANIFIQTTLDSSMDSDIEFQLKCPENEEISIVEEYIDDRERS